MGVAKRVVVPAAAFDDAPLAEKARVGRFQAVQAQVHAALAMFWADEAVHGGATRA